ncbi:polymorphic toxin-type HINT domain-containing protein [Ruminococcus sp.]|uniref:polymorphic toxin-type HINT domain-containing protein n=1 Tax=Ruminococcus sp. TaxID=41978 RepID=UPI0025FB253C|nr:polymorphic toxin-type HINT domain-containing protein [Ruminococcus sp.]
MVCTAAGDLVEGDEIYLLDGTTVYVTDSELERLAEPMKVYNLEVADFNTYFVGNEAVSGA